MKFRAATTSDRVFIVSSWLDSFRDAMPWAGMIAMDDWYPTMWPQIERLLNRSTTMVAAEPDDSLLYGFICAELDSARPRSRRHNPPCVHYCYVKAPYREWDPKPGIARRLFDAIGIDPSKQFDYTYKTPAVDQIERKIPLASHQPMLARFETGKGYRR